MKKILFVYDDRHLREVMSKVLSFMGYDSISAASAKEGLQKAVSERPDLIVLNIVLPDMDGREAARLLRSNPATRDIPILAFTATFNSLAGKSCLEAGCNDFVVKPVEYHVLHEKLKSLLGSSVPSDG